MYKIYSIEKEKTRRSKYNYTLDRTCHINFPRHYIHSRTTIKHSSLGTHTIFSLFFLSLLLFLHSIHVTCIYPLLHLSTLGTRQSTPLPHALCIPLQSRPFMGLCTTSNNHAPLTQLLPPLIQPPTRVLFHPFHVVAVAAVVVAAIQHPPRRLRLLLLHMAMQHHHAVTMMHYIKPTIDFPLEMKKRMMKILQRVLYATITIRHIDMKQKQRLQMMTMVDWISKQLKECMLFVNYCRQSVIT